MSIFSLIQSIERPLLKGASRLLNFAYRKTSISPIRLIALSIFCVSLVELAGVACISGYVYGSEFKPYIWLCLIGSVSIVFDAKTALGKFTSTSNIYNLSAYREALTSAQDDRGFSSILRLLLLIMVCSCCICAALNFQNIFGLIFAAVSIYLALYASRFFLRACDPPEPETGLLLRRRV